MKLRSFVGFKQNFRIMTKYQENFIYTTSFIKKLLKIKMVTLLLGHPVHNLAEKIFCGILFSKFLTRDYFLFFVSSSSIADSGTV